MLQLVEESSAFPLLLPSLLMYFIYFSQMYSILPALGTGTKRKLPTSEVNATAVRDFLSILWPAPRIPVAQLQQKREKSAFLLILS